MNSSTSNSTINSTSNSNSNTNSSNSDSNSISNTKILSSIYDNKDILHYFSKYLTFHDRLVLQHTYTTSSIIKNFNFFYNSNSNGSSSSNGSDGRMLRIHDICYECLDTTVYDLQDLLHQKHRNWLYNSYDNNNSNSNSNSNGNGNSNGDDNGSDDSDVYCPLERERKERDMISGYCHQVAVRAMMEVFDSNNITLSNANAPNHHHHHHHTTTTTNASTTSTTTDAPTFNLGCLFELDIIATTTSDIDKKIEEIYTNGIINNNFNIFCDNCGIFGHSHQSKLCLLYNDNTITITITKEINSIVNKMINNIIINDKYAKKREELLKTLCILCKKQSYKTSCIYQLCKSCCDNNDDNDHICHVHKDSSSNSDICKNDNCTNLKSKKCIYQLCKSCCNAMYENKRNSSNSSSNGSGSGGGSGSSSSNKNKNKICDYHNVYCVQCQQRKFHQKSKEKLCTLCVKLNNSSNPNPSLTAV